MEDFLELALRRQSCRSFAGGEIPHDKLVKCVEAGRLAPSGCNSQPWSFVVAESPEAVAEVAKAGQQLGANGFLEKASAFVVVLEEYAVLMPALRRMLDSQYFAKGDLGAAAVQICLEAETLGIGTCIIGLYDRGAIAKALGIDAEARFAALIALGNPADGEVRPKLRKKLEEVARFV